MRLRLLAAGMMCALALSLDASCATGIAADPPGAAIAASPPESAQGRFDRLVDDYFAYRFRVHPTWATETGVHDYDGQLEDFSQRACEERIKSERGFLSRLEAVEPGQLSRQSRLDLLQLRTSVLGSLLELEQIQMWKHNPDHYSSTPAASIFSLMKRDFAPLPERMRSVISRERQIPRMLAEGRKNLVDPPAVYTDVALEQLPGIVEFFQKAVPQAFAPVKDDQLQAELARTNAAVVDSLRSYEKFLKEDLSRRSHGSFALGADLYRKKLLYDEMIDEPLDALLDRGYSELRRLQQLFKDTARRIDPARDAGYVYASISADHPRPDQLLTTISLSLEEIRHFCVSRPIVTIPSRQRVRVEETPPFERALSFASMDTPGPLEKKATEAYYYVTLPEPGWPAKKVEEHMRQFCRADVVNTSTHEAYPGHYVQFLWIKQAPSKVRMLLGCGSNAEGWAHYCEEMVLDEGFHQADQKLRLGQIHDALLRACRYIVGIRLHTGGMSVEEGIRFFMDEGYQERANAERETRRGTMDPTYLVYTLGKLEILKLREDYKKARGKDFDLREFHDRFLAQGCPPLPLVREALLGSSSKISLVNPAP